MSPLILDELSKVLFARGLAVDMVCFSGGLGKQPRLIVWCEFSGGAGGGPAEREAVVQTGYAWPFS
jgi:hypothetical protein